LAAGVSRLATVTGKPWAFTRSSSINCSEQGFEPGAVRLTWRDRGWLRHSEGKTTLKARVDREGLPVEVVAIRVAVMQERLECGAEPRPVPELAVSCGRWRQ